jgi:hypothetical protein
LQRDAHRLDNLLPLFIPPCTHAPAYMLLY